MRQRQVSSSLSHDQGSSQSPSHARRYAETSDVHFVSIPPGTAPGEWFRVLLPGYEPPRWLDMQMQEGYSEEARLEVTVPKLGPSVYATRARRALPARVFRTCLTPTFAVAFIWSLVLANWAVVVCNYACRSFRPDVEGSPGQLSLGIVLLGHAILLLQIVSFWQLQATHPGAPPLVFGGGPGCSRVCARSGLQQPERAMWATNARGWPVGQEPAANRARVCVGELCGRDGARSRSLLLLGRLAGGTAQPQVLSSPSASAPCGQSPRSEPTRRRELVDRACGQTRALSQAAAVGCGRQVLHPLPRLLGPPLPVRSAPRPREPALLLPPLRPSLPAHSAR